MTIGLDISQIVYSGTGSARYHLGAVESILNYDQGNAWNFFFSALRRTLDPTLRKNIVQKGYTLSTYPLPPKVLHFLWNKTHILNINSLIGKTDWIITSDWAQPPATSQIATVVHDLAFIRYPELVAPHLRDAQSSRLKWAKKESKLFLCLSQATRTDLINYLHISPDSTEVLYPSVEIKEVSTDQIKETINKFNISRPFILTVGKIEPRKNLHRLLEAFASLGDSPFDLVIVGPAGWEKIDKSRYKNVYFTGFVSDSELAALYKACLFFAFPSIWEGFGYPLIEAMLSGAPTTTSNTSSLKEIGEGASLLFNPLNEEEIKSALRKMISDENLRTHLVKKGYERSKQFTGEKYYNNLMNILRKRS